MIKELRYLTGVELRADDDKAPVIVGYAAMFDKLSSDLGGFREKIQPGAFARTLKDGADVRALVDHDSSLIATSVQRIIDTKGVFAEAIY